MVDRRDIGIALENSLPRTLVGLGALLLCTLVAELAAVSSGNVTRLIGIDTLVEVLTFAPFAVLIAYGGRWLDRSRIEPRDYPRIGYWVTGGLLVFLLINLAMILVWPAATLRDNLAWARFAAAVGATGGLVVGTIEARAIGRGRALEHATARAEMAGDQRDWLVFANTILHREARDATDAIHDTAGWLLDEPGLTDDTATAVREISDRSAHLDTVIEDVSILLDATLGETEPEPVDLSAVLRDELAALEARHGDVETEAAIPDEAPVLADGLLHRVFANLLSNAVEHNYSSPPRVHVAVDETSTDVTVHVEDNGHGIPQDKRATLFDLEQPASSGEGLGLYLVRKLLESYGGDIRLAGTSSSGTEFVVRLVRAADHPEGARDRSASGTRSALDHHV